jgi:hypothetical protein
LPSRPAGRGGEKLAEWDHGQAVDVTPSPPWRPPMPPREPPKAAPRTYGNSDIPARFTPRRFDNSAVSRAILTIQPTRRYAIREVIARDGERVRSTSMADRTLIVISAALLLLLAIVVYHLFQPIPVH